MTLDVTTPGAGIRARWPDSCVIHLTEAQHAALPWRRPKDEPAATSEPATPGAGHNSGKLPPWETPSKLTLAEAARANVGSGRYAHERRALIEAIFDPRLGIAPLPLQLLAAVVECIGRDTGMAYPGQRYWAERIVSYLKAIPAQYRQGALKNAVTVVRQSGYVVSEKRAPERGERAVAHFAITCPTPEEKQGAIEAWCREKQATAHVTRGMTSEAKVTRTMTSAKVTRGMTSEGLRSPVDDVCGHPTSEKTGPTHYTEPGFKRNPKKEGADAPGLAGLVADAPKKTGDPPKRQRKPTKPQATPQEIDEAVGAYNEAASKHGFSRCEALTEKRRDRLAKRLLDIGGVARLRLALSALPRDDFLMGRVRPKSGGAPFRLDIERLLSTDSGMGDVLARLIDAAAAPAVATKPKAIPRY